VEPGDPSGTTGTQALTWDPEGKLAQSVDASGITSFIYDTTGEPRRTCV
jgi:YD repeat-containing protein